MLLMKGKCFACRPPGEWLAVPAGDGQEEGPAGQRHSHSSSRHAVLHGH